MIATIGYQSRDGVATLTIDQVRKRNALTLEMWRQIPEHIARAEADPAVRIIVLTGAGEQAFSSGADISEFGDKRAGIDATVAYDEAVSRAMNAVADCSKPTVASIRGICFGGGLALALCCHLLLAATDSRFRIPAAQLGLGYEFANVAKLVRRLGFAATTELLFTGAVADASEARRLGLVQQVYPAESFATDAGAYVATIAGNAPLTLQAVVRALHELHRPEAERDGAAADVLVAKCFASSDYLEGQAAFREKRAPRFTGK